MSRSLPRGMNRKEESSTPRMSWPKPPRCMKNTKRYRVNAAIATPSLHFSSQSARLCGTAHGRLKMETDSSRQCAGRDVMRSTKRRKKIVERLFVRQIDHRQAGAYLVPVAVKNVVMPHGNVEEVPGCNARRIVVVILRARRGYLDERGPVKGCGAQARRADRTGWGCMHASAIESCFELLIRRDPGYVHRGVGAIWPVRAIPSRARHRTGDQTAIVAPVEAEPRPFLPGLVLQVSGLVKQLIVVDA